MYAYWLYTIMVMWSVKHIFFFTSAPISYKKSLFYNLIIRNIFTLMTKVYFSAEGLVTPPTLEIINWAHDVLANSCWINVNDVDSTSQQRRVPSSNRCGNSCLETALTTTTNHKNSPAVKVSTTGYLKISWMKKFVASMAKALPSGHVMAPAL